MADTPASPLYHYTAQPDASTATLTVHGGRKVGPPISRYLTGKFCEHLGRNILNGHLAEILNNPTFADMPFHNGSATPDGRIKLYTDREQISNLLRRSGSGPGYPATVGDELVEAYFHALAAGWIAEGQTGDVRFSPDTGPNGGRAQRVEVKAAGQGVAQWTPLPLHRTRGYEFTLRMRSVGVSSVTVALWKAGDTEPLAKAALSGVTSEWQALEGKLSLPESLPADTIVRFSVTADGPGQLVMDHALLLPDDHVGGCDPDVIRLLKESKLPLLRWPGGNFVSGYNWRDGIGPVMDRPTRGNPAWGNVEPNLFGTAEFIAFCRAVGCEPMICVNGGDGTPEEAAGWIEYCNSGADTPMGALRVKHGHAEPFNVHHWEVGNELWGDWQVHWTTPHGYTDRYQRFSVAMLKADPSIHLYACGAPVLWGTEWNDALIAATAPDLPATTDHPLIGGNVTADTDPLDVFRDFMGVPRVLERRWKDLEGRMRAAGITKPELAITELQMFGRIGDPAAGKERVLNGGNLVNPGTQGEAVYDILYYHVAARLGEFVHVITHSATVNHGGGLRKQNERVYANPCHYAQSAFTALAEATPVAVEGTCAVTAMPIALGDLQNAHESGEFPAVDALAAVAENGDLLLSIAHCGTTGLMTLTVNVEGHASASEARVTSLTAPYPWSANTLRDPEAIVPVEATAPVEKGRITLSLPAWTVAVVRIPIQ